MKKTLIILILLAFSFIGCEQVINRGNQGLPPGDNANTGTQRPPADPPLREWTIMIYMAADNDLESAAIANFNELEAIRNLHNAPISIVVLLDRSPYFDRTNGNWSDTRVFEIKSDPNGLTPTMISTRLDSPELGLTIDTETDLNTADPLVLSRFINFAMRAYPAERYALFMWGHGTGWRALAFDDTSGQYMSLSGFGRAVAGKGLSVIGFDTCFGGVLEVAYQIRNDAELFVGSIGTVLSTGWDYRALFADFLQRSNLSVDALGDSIQNQFIARYGNLNNASISQVRLSHVDNLFVKFNNFAREVANAITTQAARDLVLNEILHNVEGHYFITFPSDLYIDIYDFSHKITAIRSGITADPLKQDAILLAANELQSALALAVPSSWAHNGTTNKLGVHLIPLQGIAVPTASHELAYVRGSMALDKNAFVNNSQHWVPNMVPQSDSLLDKLFYWVF